MHQDKTNSITNKMKFYDETQRMMMLYTNIGSVRNKKIESR
jgi:hypothetical protein